MPGDDGSSADQREPPEEPTGGDEPTADESEPSPDQEPEMAGEESKTRAEEPDTVANEPETGDEEPNTVDDEPETAPEDPEPVNENSEMADQEFTDPGGETVAEPPAGRPEVESPATRPMSEQDPSTDAESGAEAATDQVPPDVRKYDRFKKVDGAQYERVNDFLRDRTYITAREWAIARLCSDFRTETGVEMTKIGENLPHLVPFMTDTYSPQAVNQARSSFETKVRKAGATFLYGAMSDFFTADELDEVMYEVTEVAKFLLEVEGVDLAVAEELDSEERISSVMREVRQASDELRYEGTTCPNCGHEIGGSEHEAHDHE